MTATPWFTPTPMPTANATSVLAPSLVGSGVDVQIAESLVGGYQYANQNGGIDFIMTGVLILLIVGGIFWLWKSASELTEK